MNTEHRNRPRRHIDASVKILEGKGYYHNATGSDVSLSGLCFITAKSDIEAGQTLVVQFDLPLKGRLVKIEGEAKVVHKIDFGSNAYKVGLAFTHLDALSAWNVESYVNNVNASASQASDGISWNSLGDFSKR